VNATIDQAPIGLGMATLMGACIGFERQWRQRMADLRTNTLVAIGAASWLHTPDTPAIRFTRALTFAASLVHNCCGLSGCSPPLDGSDWDTTQPPEPEAFTSRLPTGRSPFPSLDMTTTSIGLLCRRDLHPLK
jgi:hypothetical protein